MFYGQLRYPATRPNGIIRVFGKVKTCDQKLFPNCSARNISDLYWKLENGGGRFPICNHSVFGWAG